MVLFYLNNMHLRYQHIVNLLIIIPFMFCKICIITQKLQQSGHRIQNFHNNNCHATALLGESCPAQYPRQAKIKTIAIHNEQNQFYLISMLCHAVKPNWFSMMKNYSVVTYGFCHLDLSLINNVCTITLALLITTCRTYRLYQISAVFALHVQMKQVWKRVILCF